jgi:hypothetical protein
MQLLNGHMTTLLNGLIPSTSFRPVSQDNAWYRLCSQDAKETITMDKRPEKDFKE